MMIVTDHSRDLPYAILVLPDVNESSLTGRLGLFRLWMMKAMNTQLDGAIAAQGIDLERPWNELPAHFAADVLLYAFGQILPADAQSIQIVIELHIVYEERAEFFQIAPVKGIEERGVQRRDRARKLIGWLRTLRRLGADPDDGHGEQGQEHQ